MQPWQSYPPIKQGILTHFSRQIRQVCVFGNAVNNQGPESAFIKRVQPGTKQMRPLDTDVISSRKAAKDKNAIPNIQVIVPTDYVVQDKTQKSFPSCPADTGSYCHSASRCI